MFIDTHTHLYSEQFDDDRNAVVKRAIAGGVTSFFLPNIDLDSVEPLLKLEQTFPENCHAMMGLHPCSVQANYMNQLEQLYAWFKKRSFCAVGEIGIDLYWDKSYVEEQKNAFRIQINWAKEFKIPIVIHARDSFKEIFEILDEENSPDLTGIFHCFTGDLNDVRKIQQYGGFVFGIGGVVTYKKSTLPEVLPHIPLSEIVLETDSPYLAPTPHRGKRNESLYVVHVAEKVAEIYGVPLLEIAEKTTSNARKIFQV